MLNRDLGVDLDFSVGSYHFRFYDLRVVDAEIPNMYEEFSDYRPHLSFNFDKARIRVVFTLTVIQEKYPYFEDFGAG